MNRTVLSIIRADAFETIKLAVKIAHGYHLESESFTTTDEMCYVFVHGRMSLANRERVAGFIEGMYWMWRREQVKQELGV